MKPRIQLTIVTKDSISTSVIKAPHVTNAMYDAAWDLVFTMTTNKRRKTSLYTQDQKKKTKAAACERERKQMLGPGGRPLRKPKKSANLVKRNKAVLAAVGQMGADAIAKELGRPSRASRLARPGTGNADSTGIHSMVEGNRGDHQT